jgi:hypothetical protein
MQLSTCRTCGRAIRSDVMSCPSCGVVNGTGKRDAEHLDFWLLNAGNAGILGFIAYWLARFFKLRP